MAGMEHLDRAVEIAGSQDALARRIGVRQSLISMWKHRGRVPAEYCPDIERATSGAVRCEDLRPDVAWAVLREQVAPADSRQAA
jgi:DNA-binding transcriptional regulator YdaS (Cro superfamily)